MIRVVAAFSVVGILLFVVKLVLYSTWNEFAEWLNSSEWGRVLDVYVQAAIVPPWQWFMFGNSCLMLGIFFYIRSCVHRDEVGAAVSEGVAEGVLKWGTIVRRVLTTYTMACTFYLTAREAMDWNLPPLGDQWFPWG